MSDKICPKTGKECNLGIPCENCMQNEMTEEEYDDFIEGLNVPKGV